MLTVVLFVAGIALLIIGAEGLVRGASGLALALGVTPLVVGLTVVAFGTSAPEVAVTIQSSLAGQSDLALGNVVGSNIVNVLLILGLAAALTPVVVPQRLVRLDIPLMIGMSVLVLLLGLDRVIGQLDGLLLLVGVGAYTAFVIRQSRHERAAVVAEYEEEFAEITTQRPWQIVRDVGLVIAGLALLVLGARWLVTGAVAIARFLGMSELVIGLTIVAVGTGAPELATTVMASVRGERDIAIGNVVGSNLFNLLLVLGAAAMVSPSGIIVPSATVRFDIPVMIVTAVACLPIFARGHTIARWQGVIFIGYYAAYTTYLILAATQHRALPAFSGVMLMFVVPMTVITLVVLAVRTSRSSRSDFQAPALDTSKPAQ